MVLGEGENFFSREKRFSPSPNPNPFQEKRGIFKVKDSTISVISTCIGNRAFHNITLKGEKVNTGNIKTMVTQIKTRDLNNNIYATINKLPDVMEKKK